MDMVKIALCIIFGVIFILFPVWMGRRKSVPNFSYWMETEGAPILSQVFLWFVILCVVPPLLALLFLLI
jgi:hypothetical protein